VSKPDRLSRVLDALSGPMGRADFHVNNVGEAVYHPPVYRRIIADRERVENVAYLPFPEAEVLPPLRDKTAAERKAEPIYSGVLKYFPDALALVARVSQKSNVKHNGPDAPLQWSRSKSADQMDALVRHELTPEHLDAESGEPEIGHALWRLMAQAQLIEEKRNRERGVRSYSGVE